jgi:hypothetical protein
MTNIQQAFEKQCKECIYYCTIIDFTGKVHSGCDYYWQAPVLGCKDRCVV